MVSERTGLMDLGPLRTVSRTLLRLDGEGPKEDNVPGLAQLG